MLKGINIIMNIKRVGTHQRWSNAVIYNGIAYICGQTARQLRKGITYQTESALENLLYILEEIGSDKNKLLSAVIYLKDVKDYEGMNMVWDSWLPEGAAPARTCVIAELSDEECLIEITVVAAIS